MADDESRESALLNAQSAARYLNISERSLWTYTQSGTIPSIRIGRSIRYSLASLDEWINQQSAFSPEVAQ